MIQRPKLFIALISILLLLIAAVSLSASRIITALTRYQLQKTFSGSTVSIGKCFFNPTRSLMFSDIKIKRQGSCDLSIEEVSIKYDFPSLFTGTIGDFYVKRITCNDTVIRDVQGTVRIENSVLSVDSLTARLFNGDLSGNLQLALDKNNEFSVVLTIAGLNLGTFSEDFKLDDKFQITGKLNGTISLRGGRAGITDINGDFSTDISGGTLVIKDTRFLENMAKRSGQSLDILIENFEHYQYNKGMMKVSIDENDLVLDIALDGDTGKRTFDVILHDVITNKRRVL